MLLLVYIILEKHNIGTRENLEKGGYFQKVTES